MYRIGELAKMAEVTPDTIRYYEKQQMMEHEVRTEGGFRLYTESDLQRLKFIRHARQLGFSLESIRELLSIRIDPEHHTCQESKGIAGLTAFPAWCAHMAVMVCDCSPKGNSINSPLSSSFSTAKRGR